MKILIITHIFPFPLNEGGKTAQYNFIEQAAATNEITLLNLSPVNETLKIGLKSEIKNIKIEEISYLDESLNLNLVQKIIRKLIWVLKDFLPPKNITISNNQYFLNPIPIREKHTISQVVEIIKKVKPDIVQVDFIDNADISLIIPDTVKKVIVIHDLRSQSVRQFLKNEDSTFLYQDYLFKNVANKELPFLKQFDLVISFNREEIMQMGNWNSKVVLNPFSVNSKLLSFPLSIKPVQQLAFLGPDTHYPNMDGLLWYAETVGAYLFERYNLSISVIGKWSKKNKDKFKRYPFIVFKGFVENLSTELDGSALVVPIRIGSGIRTKILEAFALGIPVISSSIGISGIPAKPNVHYLLADNPEDYNEAVYRLIDQPDLLSNLRCNAREFVKEKYSQELMTRERLTHYKLLLNEMESGMTK